MKRIFATLLALTLALSLTACGSKSDSSDNSAPADAETPAETPEESTGSWAPDGPVTMIVSYKAERHGPDRPYSGPVCREVRRSDHRHRQRGRWFRLHRLVQAG